MERLINLVSNDFSCFDAAAPCVDPASERLAEQFARLLEQVRRADWRLGAFTLNADGCEYLASFERSVSDPALARVAMIAYVRFSAAYRASWVATARWYCSLAGVTLVV
jgi:hypothetical protein